MSERLWAGWRMAYIQDASERPAPDACLFCTLAGSEPGPDRYILETYRHGFCVLNAFPYTSGHLMIAPFSHTDSLAPGGAEVAAELLAAVERGRRALEHAYRPDGFNVGVNLGRAAGAGVPGHVHWHVVPRWNGDTNFMPALAETRVLPESLTDTYRRIVDALGELPESGLRVVRRGS